jgi:hypothetical protein
MKRVMAKGILAQLDATISCAIYAGKQLDLHVETRRARTMGRIRVR